MQHLSSASDVYHDALSQPRPPFPLSHDEQFTLAAAYLASLHPLQPCHVTDEPPGLSQAPEPYAAALPPSSLFDSHVHTCLTALHSSPFVPSLPQPYQHITDVAHRFDPTAQPQLYTASSVRAEAAVDSVKPSWHYPPYTSIDSSADHTLQEQLSDLASSCTAIPYMASPADAAWPVVTSTATSRVVPLSMKALAAADPLSVSPSHYPLTRLDSASHYSTDSASSYQSSASSVQSPLSPRQPTAVTRNRDQSYSGIQRADMDLYSDSVPSSAPLYTAPPPSPVVGSEQPVTILPLPSLVYSAVQSAISAALQASPASAAVPVTSSLSEKRKVVRLDAERRLKHRVIDANRRRRETVLVERFAQLSGQRNESLTRDRVTTLEVACDRYEELTRMVEDMKDRMIHLRERLLTLDSTALDGEQPYVKRKGTDRRRTARKRPDAQQGKLKRQLMQLNLPSQTSAGDTCKTTSTNTSDSTSQS